MAAWFTADTHFGEGRKFGRFPNVSDDVVKVHDEILLDNINRHVQREDFLYILGDFAWKQPQKYRMQIRCKHCVFIRGNHDKFQDSLHAFGEVHDRKVVRNFGDTKAVLAHYPEAYWEGSHKGWYHFYGHTHRQRERTLDSVFPSRRSMDVGVDNAKALLDSFRPFSMEELLACMAFREGHDHVSFYRREFGEYQ